MMEDLKPGDNIPTKLKDWHSVDRKHAADWRGVIRSWEIALMRYATSEATMVLMDEPGKIGPRYHP